MVDLSRRLAVFWETLFLFNWIFKGTLEGGKFKEESEDSDSSSDDDDVAAKIGQVVEVSDAELFKRCGGLTGHKVRRIIKPLKLKQIKLRAHDMDTIWQPN